MTTTDFILEVLLLERARSITVEDLQTFALPFTVPFYCMDWVTFLFQVLTPHHLPRDMEDLRTNLLEAMHTKIIRHRTVVLGTLDPPLGWSAAVHDALLILQGGLNVPVGHPVPVHNWSDFLVMLGHCMDLASHLHHALFTGQQAHATLCTYAEALRGACAAQRQVLWVMSTQEGRGACREPWATMRSSPAADSGRYVPTALFPDGSDLPEAVYHLFAQGTARDVYKPPGCSRPGHVTPLHSSSTAPVCAGPSRLGPTAGHPQVDGGSKRCVYSEAAAPAGAGHGGAEAAHLFPEAAEGGLPPAGGEGDVQDWLNSVLLDEPFEPELGCAPPASVIGQRRGREGDDWEEAPRRRRR